MTAYKNWQQIRSLERERVNIDEVMANAELLAIAKAKASTNGNGSNGAQKLCWCRECEMPDGTRHALHSEADCLYTAARSALVEEAYRNAIERIGDPRKRHFAAEFNRQMDLLAFNAGLLR